MDTVIIVFALFGVVFVAITVVAIGQTIIDWFRRP